jgi:hypothetical protein
LFDRWCHTRDYAAGADPIVVVEFIAGQIERGLSTSTIQRRLAAIAFGFRHEGRRTPTDAAVVQRETRNAARRVLEHRREAAPLRLGELRP